MRTPAWIFWYGRAEVLVYRGLAFRRDDAERLKADEFWLIGRTSGRAAFLLGFDYRIGVRLAEEEKNHGIPRYTLLLELNDLAPR